MQNIRQDTYDPVKAHEYYERTKKLKGRKKSSQQVTSKAAKKPVVDPKRQKAMARISRLRDKLNRLNKALSATEAELSSRRQAARDEKKKNSDGKTTAKERQASQDYRDKHQQEIKNKQKQDNKKDNSSTPASKSNGLASMSIQELNTRALKLKGLVREAQHQLSNANQQLGQLAHSALVSDPHVSGLYAQFKSAERIPSK